MGQVVAFNHNTLPSEMQDVFNPDSMAGDLYDGVGSGFPVLSIRGSKWRVKHGGVEDLVLNADEEPAPSIEVVMLKASKGISKIWYEKKYTEGDDAAPDCFSVDGIAPDSQSENPQAKKCAACKHNQWGSRITEAGKKAKACADARRMAVVFADDVSNTAFGGPMLLRIPAVSLSDLAVFGKGMAAKGFPYNAIVTRIGFDSEVSFPKLTYKAVRALKPEEMAQVAEHFQGDVLTNILEAAGEVDAPARTVAEKKQEAVDTDFDEPAPVEDDAAAKKAEAAAKRKAAVAKKKADAKAKAKADEAAAAASGGDDLDDDLDDILNGLDNAG